MTKAEFAELIAKGRDIMFDVRNKHYTILTWTDNGINIGEQYPNDTKDDYFSSPEELLDNYLVDGIPLGELCNQVVITDYS